VSLLGSNKDARQVAFILLLHPSPVGPTPVTDAFGWDENHVRSVMTRMEEEGLLTWEWRPADTRSLFYQLASVWCEDQASVALAREPVPLSGLSEVLMLGLAHPESQPGWALSGLHAAAAYGIPVGSFPDVPHSFYVPSEAVARRAKQELGQANGSAVRAVITPSPMFWVTRHRVDGAAGRLTNSHWPLVNPLVSALEVARENPVLLTAWDPPSELSHRPWL
jgi:hypothetical protein